jgi:hypothetical protein
MQKTVETGVSQFPDKQGRFGAEGCQGAIDLKTRERLDTTRSQGGHVNKNILVRLI